MNELITSNSEKDYNLPHTDIIKAKEIEKYHELFRLFITRDKEKITLCLAAVRTLARETDGIFSKEEMDQVLGYLNTDTRNQVIKTIVKYGWIISNGVRYQFPERTRYMLMFLFTVFVGEVDSFNREIALSLAVNDLDEIVGVDEETSAESLQIAFGTLRRIKTEFINCLEQRSPVEGRNLLIKGKDFHETIGKIEDRLKKINKNSYHYTQTTEVRGLLAEIMRLSQELHEFIQQDIQANARSFGQYLTPEQVEEFLHEAPLDLLAGLIQKNYSSPRKPSFLSREELNRKAVNYLENKSEKQELSPPPPITEIVERRYEETNFEGASNLFHKEIMSKLMSDSVIPLHDVVIKNNYGETVFHTGLLTTLKNDLSGTSEDLFDINLKDYILEINEGFIRNITEGDIRLKNKL
ncbi:MULTISPECIES: hypothetical protein [unclassified Paenibacillus]|uniref:hypothetical protein n=1 Tax=unclassified Paenibacillus TaxID=185978 RepID=UPI00247591EA|nr:MULTISPECIES: hypothetical protein [unclassified Paenibacillus]MDH6428060.1 hypothetical protein [Paenibacillus sp. PastH-4]MDH6444310.1 hypothetical protein [Paenibacillus sp. PastF-4]MDH6528211.1 hypothetical protein [Paenibacillus sp. PastH-3]